MNTSQRLFLFSWTLIQSFKFNSRTNCQHLTNWTRWNKRDKVSSCATSVFKWRFRSRRRWCCVSSLLWLLELNTFARMKEQCVSEGTHKCKVPFSPNTNAELYLKVLFVHLRTRKCTLQSRLNLDMRYSTRYSSIRTIQLNCQKTEHRFIPIFVFFVFFFFAVLRKHCLESWHKNWGSPYSFLR